jgi:hypothetical protein
MLRPALWMCHSLYVAVLPPCGCATVFICDSPPCGCATVFMLRFSRPVDVPQSLCCDSPALWMCHSRLCCGSPALWMCHSLYVAVFPRVCHSLYVASRPVDVPQSLCCVIFALVRLPRSFVDLVILTTLFGVFDRPLPKLLMSRDRRFLSFFLLGGSVRLAGSV